MRTRTPYVQQQEYAAQTGRHFHVPSSTSSSPTQQGPSNFMYTISTEAEPAAATTDKTSPSHLHVPLHPAIRRSRQLPLILQRALPPHQPPRICWCTCSLESAWQHLRTAWRRMPEPRLWYREPKHAAGSCRAAAAGLCPCRCHLQVDQRHWACITAAALGVGQLADAARLHFDQDSQRRQAVEALWGDLQAQEAGGRR